MKLRALHVQGFGRLVDRGFAFAPGLNVVVGPNEAGKSTLAAALVASLYGLQRGEKERWRPWLGTAYGTTLAYETADGATWEVQRAFDRDAKGVRIFDADGVDAAARIGNGRTLVPGEAHLGLPLEVFVQTACVRQQAIALEAAAADGVAGALARALGGGPKEDAAIGAAARLDEALRKHVGTERAHKNAPLKKLREIEREQHRAATEARAALEALAALRERIAAERAERDRDAAAAAMLDRRLNALRAAQVRARLDALTEYRNDIAALQSARAAFDDVAAFPHERMPALDDAYHSWRSAQSVAEAADLAAAEEALTAAEASELDARTRDVGRLDDDALAALRAAAAQADAAQLRSAAAGHDAAARRRAAMQPTGAGTAAAVTTVAAALAGGGLAIAHLWVGAVLAAIVALVLGTAAVRAARERAALRREAEAHQHRADAAQREERTAAQAVAAVLEPLGLTTIDELVRRRERLVALRAREREASKSAVRAQTARAAATSEAARFDALADALVPQIDGSREARRAAAQARAARRRERDGLDARAAMLGLRRGDLLRGDDEYALEAEYAGLLAAGVEPAAVDDAGSLRALERERDERLGRLRESDRRIAHLEGELRAGEDGIPEVAPLDETLAATRAEIARLEGFARAVGLAHTAIETRKDEAHRGFARRLEEYSAEVLATVSGGRYGEIRVDPTTLAIRARVPETGAIEELRLLSAGTRDQIALVVRFATARMFSEGLETPPLLLDDPFAFWDAERIARCLPVLLRGALDAQCVLFTASEELADAAERAGATRIALRDALATASS